MDKAKAIEAASKFKENWEIDSKKRIGVHKPTGFEIHMGPIWRDENGKRKYDAIFSYRAGDYPQREGTIEEINELQRQFGILYEAGYMPGMSKEEREEESRRIHEEAAKARAEFQAQAAKEEEWRRTHPEEYIAQVEANVKDYYDKAMKENEKWYQDRDMDFPEERKKYYAEETKRMIEKFHREFAVKNNNR